MRRLFTTAEVHATKDRIAWAAEKKRITPIGRGVYGKGPEPPTPLDWERAAVLRSGREARGGLAGVLHGLDSVELDGHPTRRDRLSADKVITIGGIRCADGHTTLVDLAASLDDRTWEQALESGLRKRLTTVAALAAVRGVPGTARIRRVLALRPPGAPATESLLETVMVQLCRQVPEVGELTRQLEIYDDHGSFIARLDLARPMLFFFELDGQGHEGQPVYDAVRQTNVVAHTGMLVGRFTWTEVTRYTKATKARLARLALKAAERQRSLA